MPRWALGLGAALVASSVALAAAEIVLRLIDHQPLTRLALVTEPAPVLRRATRPDRQYVGTIPLAPGVEASWYEDEPQPRPRLAEDPQIATRLAKYPDDPYTPLFAFNRSYLKWEICGGRRDALPRLDDFFYFDPIDGAYPTYRHLAHLSAPSWFTTNNYGWRGPDVGLNRPRDTIRIAFVGASTTIDSYSVPFSHPELVGHWLELWARRRGAGIRIEVINAGRTGIDSRSIAAIVKQELVPIDPDLVVFYEGANQFTPGGLMHSPLRRAFPRPKVTFRERTTLERRSALVRRLLSAWDRFRGGTGAEPAKPPATVTWPSGVDEQHPDPHNPALPMDLPQVVRDLDAMRGALAPSGGELAVASFVWLARPGLRLDPVRHANIYRYLNDTLWPIPYAHVRRMADFQNRVFATYARDAHTPFLDIAARFPLDPDLFDDPIHLNYAGLRLQGWEFLQQIVPILDARLAAGLWPRVPPPPRTVHPAFAQAARRVVSAADLAAACAPSD